MGKVEDVERASASFYGSMGSKNISQENENEKQEILNLWQNLFIEIYHKYQNRFTELIPSDTKGLVDFWTNYLTYIENLLGVKVPTYYSELIEEKRLLEIHKNLLTNQTRIFNQYLLDLANENPILVTQQAEANSILDKIKSRIELTQGRLEQYNQYQKNRYDLLEWFQKFETAKSKLQLRNLSLKRIPKIINEIELLIEEISTVGEKYMTTLATNQNELMVGHVDEVLSSLKIENIAFRQRISNLTASLNTWRDFLQSISLTGATYEELLQRIQQTHDRHTGILNVIEAEFISNNGLLDESVQQLQHHIDELNADKDIVRLEQSYQQLQQCINLGQARNLNQIIWMLQQKRHDLIHEYKSLQCNIGERDNLRASFFMVCLQFCEWIAKNHEKLQSVHSGLDIMFHKTNYLEALNVRENEKAWIFQTANQLMTLYNQDSKICAEIQEKIDQVAESWSSLQNLYDSQYAVTSMSLISSATDDTDPKFSTIHSLEIRINEIREWLIEKQKQVCLPFRFELVSDMEFNDYILEQESLQKCLEKESGGIGEVLNLCEMICATDEHVNNRTNLKMLYQSMKNLDRRWKSICFLLPNRKKNLFSIWKSLKKIQKLQEDNMNKDWLSQQKLMLDELTRNCNKMSHECLIELEVRIKNWLDHLHSVDDAAHQLKFCRQDLVTNQFIHIEKDSSVSKLLQTATNSIEKWRDLLVEGGGLEKRIQNYSSNYTEFVTRYRDLLLLLTNLKTEVENLKFSLPDGRTRMEKDVDDEETLKNVHTQLLGYQESIMNFERLYEEQLKPMASEYELLELKENVNNILRLHSKIKNKLKSLRPQILLVDESTQVNTLYLNTAVQVDTLNYSDSTYKHELYAAYSELSKHIGRLIEAVDGDDAARWPELLSNCESALELCKHLCRILISDYPEFAASEQKIIENLQIGEDRFKECLEKWRCKQQQQRFNFENSDASGKNCIYCTTLDWQAADNDLWRLDQWLQYADKTQQTYDFQALSNYSIEQLEDIIQDHREFLLDLDSHKMILASLSTISEHLLLHQRKKVEQIPHFREKLEKCAAKWDSVCGEETAWQLQLHKNLLSNDEFYNIIDDQTKWLRESELKIRQLYPSELTQEVNMENHPPLDNCQRQLYETKLKHLQDMRQEMDQCEPRILNLQAVAKQLFMADDENMGSKIFYERYIHTCLRISVICLHIFETIFE
jgi:nesprin-1